MAKAQVTGCPPVVCLSGTVRTVSASRVETPYSPDKARIRAGAEFSV